MSNNPESPQTNEFNLEDELKHIRATAQPSITWDELKPLLITFYKKVVCQFQKERTLEVHLLKHNENKDNESGKEVTPQNQIDETILEYLEDLEKVPFTIQRISELLLDPMKHYKTALKFNNALRKCVIIDPR